ncbi:MAG TPA: AlpA family phage regulatory protein [Alphaproteobacteria bacterium]|nr:AlpA family phage regulatory protein [Alphaproteobacteria bacterium]
MRFLRFSQLESEKGIGYSRMHIDRLEKAGKFPRRVPIGENSVAWIETEIDQWQQEKADERGGADAKAA